MNIKSFSLAALIVILACTAFVVGQNPLPAGGTLVQPAPSQYGMIPISATAAVNNQTTLTIPAPPPGQYNYICKVTFTASQDGTSSANTNQVTTATNFNSWAIKYSLEATANKSLTLPFDFGAPSTGCTKSVAPGTATTFVSPAAIANTAFTWTAAYFQAP